jgi:hypothetical protein
VKIALGSFFRKFAEIFTSQGAPLVSTTPVENLPPVSMTLAANFATGTVANLLPVSVANNGNNIWIINFVHLPPVSTTQMMHLVL